MKRPRPRRALLARWPQRCQACGTVIHCPECCAFQPVRRWTPAEILEITQSDEFDELFFTGDS